MPQGKKGNSRKCGRNLEGCKAYRAANRREINKARKLRKHIKHNPNDKAAQDAAI